MAREQTNHKYNTEYIDQNYNNLDVSFYWPLFGTGQDFIIIIDFPLHYNTAFIASEVMKKGATGVAYITVYPDEVKISLRLSKTLKPETVEKYRVDLLARQMDGGGHKGASGAEMENLELSLEEIKGWTKEKELETEIIDLRQK